MAGTRPWSTRSRTSSEVSQRLPGFQNPVNAKVGDPLRNFELETRIWLPRPPAEVFAFFADAANLAVLTPPWLNFRILTPGPIEMKPGTRLDYRLRLRGVPLRWQSEITSWEPPQRFVDQQRRGPYRLWIHEHTFLEHDGGTWARDRVRYAVPGGALVNRLLVAPDLNRIFAYRHQKLAEIFGEGPPSSGALTKPRARNA